MNAVQAHLVLDHIPVVGQLFATASFGYGFLKKNHGMEKFGLLTFIGLALLTIPVWLTGLAIEDLVEGVTGISYALFVNHKLAATVSFVTIEILGAWSLLGWYRFRHAAAYPGRFLITVLVLSGLASLAMVWTGHTGAQIQHSEVIAISHFVEPTKNGGHPYVPLDGLDRDR